MSSMRQARKGSGIHCGGDVDAVLHGEQPPVSDSMLDVSRDRQRSSGAGTSEDADDATPFRHYAYRGGPAADGGAATPQQSIAQRYTEQYGLGFKMLKGMGYKVGTGLGADSSGMASPITVVVKNDRRGLAAPKGKKGKKRKVIEGSGTDGAQGRLLPAAVVNVALPGCGKRSSRENAKQSEKRRRKRQKTEARLRLPNGALLGLCSDDLEKGDEHIRAVYQQRRRAQLQEAAHRQQEAHLQQPQPDLEHAEAGRPQDPEWDDMNALTG